VVTRATGRANNPSNAAMKPVVDVLPLVPVTPTLKNEAAQLGGAGGARITGHRRRDPGWELATWALARELHEQTA
jgi:hypothetical protein